MRTQGSFIIIYGYTAYPQNDNFKLNNVKSSEDSGYETRSIHESMGNLSQNLMPKSIGKYAVHTLTCVACC